jgi:phthalate 4,5-cis-dihydrodiol dehydrogenase
MLRVGVAGLGVAAQQVLPNIASIKERVVLTAGADIREEARKDFAAAYPGVKTFATVEELCGCDDVDAVWVSTPNEYHAPNAVAAARNGKHVICEKPMATTLDECRQIVDAARENGVKYLQGHSKIYYEPLRRMREVIKSGSLGRVTQISTLNYNDWIIRPFTESEYNTALGTGPVYRQGPHQIDIVRYLAGSRATAVSAVATRSEAAYPNCESEYTALIRFEDGLGASLAFNAQGYFDAGELTWGIGESGWRTLNVDSILPRTRRTAPVTPDEKYRLQSAGDPYGRGIEGTEDKKALRNQPFFGLTLVTCQRGVIRQSPNGVYVYEAAGRREIACRSGYQRGAAELLEMCDAIDEGRDPYLDGAWGLATIEICEAIVASAQAGREVQLQHQAPYKHVTTW